MPSFPTTAPLAGVRVLDLTRNLAGPYCTLTLAELGADVVKVESLAGDDTRAWTPTDANGSSAIFASANRGKRSICLDLDTPAGVDLVQSLARRSDVLVESFRPGALDRRGLGWHALHELNDRLVYCSISAFGSTGPRAGEPGYDPVIQAATGIMSITGEADGPGVRLGIGAVDLGAGLWATVGILAALRTREQTGLGCRVDTSLFETAAWWLTYHLAMFAATGTTPGRHGTASPAIVPYETFETASAPLFIAAANDRFFQRLCRALELDQLPADSRFADNASRVANRELLHCTLEERLKQNDADHWEQRLRAVGIPCSTVRTVAEFAHDPQTSALGLLGEHQGKSGVALPLTFAGDRPPIDSRTPQLGEHTDDVLLELGLDDNDITSLRQTGAIG